ncbi:MAG TPA: hypothetical protein VFS67_19240 [Polyangiaceae bacterium]|nr:hypothetical protein [Polyangiaceae bacterium]
MQSSPSAGPGELMPGILLTPAAESVSSATPPRAEPAGLRVSPWLEFLVVGGATLLLFPLSWALQRGFGADPVLLGAGFLTFHAAYVLNDPHFAVTYLLFYRDVRARALGREVPFAQRLRYWISGFVLPAALVTWAALALALHSAAALGWIVQLMFLLVGWHYVKQGFGVLSVLSARRGVSLRARERQLLLAHCFAAWAFAWANPSMPAGEFEEKGVVYWGVAHPRWLELMTGAVLAASTIALGALLLRNWRRERRALPLAPLASFLITIWSWTIYSRIDPMVQYLIPALHSLQYFYFVWLMQGNRALSEEGPPRFGRSASTRLAALALSAWALGWLLLRGLPALLDELLVPPVQRGGLPDALGTTPYFAAFFAVVNIHHYCMDHVIWRRENPETRFLRAAQ